MCLNDLEDELRINGVYGIVIDLIQLCVLLYAGDIILTATTASDLQKAADILEILHKVEINRKCYQNQNSNI